MVFAFLSVEKLFSHSRTSSDVISSIVTKHSLKKLSSTLRYFEIVVSALLASFKLNKYSFKIILFCMGIVRLVLSQYFFCEFIHITSYANSYFTNVAFPLLTNIPYLYLRFQSSHDFFLIQ